MTDAAAVAEEAALKVLSSLAPAADLHLQLARGAFDFTYPGGQVVENTASGGGQEQR